MLVRRCWLVVVVSALLWRNRCWRIRMRLVLCGRWLHRLLLRLRWRRWLLHVGRLRELLDWGWAVCRWRSDATLRCLRCCASIALLLLLVILLLLVLLLLLV